VEYKNLFINHDHNCNSIYVHPLLAPDLSKKLKAKVYFPEGAIIGMKFLYLYVIVSPESTTSVKSVLSV